MICCNHFYLRHSVSVSCKSERIIDRASIRQYKHKTQKRKVSFNKLVCSTDFVLRRIVNSIWLKF